MVHLPGATVFLAGVPGSLWSLAIRICLVAGNSAQCELCLSPDRFKLMTNTLSLIEIGNIQN